MSVLKKATAVLAGGLLAVSLAACSNNNGGETPGGDDALPTVTAGKLTIAAADPGYPPYVIDNNPENGEGFETAVAYAVAAELGFAKEDVVWVRANWDLAIAPGAKPYDFTLQQVSIRDDRKEFLDFSSSYYSANQAVVTVATSPAAGADSLAALKEFRIGAAAGTSSLEAIENVIKPTTPASVYNNNDDLKLALQSGQIDALVVDLPTALFVGYVELDGGSVLGQLEGTAAAHGGWGLVLEKDSALTEHVTKAVDAIRANGTLDRLVEQWITNQGAPILR